MNIPFTKKNSIVFASLLLAWLAQPVFAEDGRIGLVRGDVKVNGVAASRGTSVNVGDTVTASRGSLGFVVMKDKTTLKIAADTSIRISEYKFEEKNPVSGKVVISLIKGSLRFISGLINKRRPGASSIRTPVATMGIRGTDGVFTYTPSTGEFTVQFDRGTGIMTFRDAVGNAIATVPVGTGQQVSAKRGATTATVQVSVPTAVTQALNAAKDSDGKIDLDKVKEAAAKLTPAQRIVLLAVAATQEGVDTTDVLGAIIGADTSANVGKNAATVVFVANLIDPGKAVENTSKAINTISSERGTQTTVKEALDIVEASAEAAPEQGAKIAKAAFRTGVVDETSARKAAKIGKDKAKKNKVKSKDDDEKKKDDDEKDDKDKKDDADKDDGDDDDDSDHGNPSQDDVSED